MFKILFQILIVLYIIFLFFNILDLKKYNVNGMIMNSSNKHDFLIHVNSLNPTIINYENDYNIESVILDKGDSIENIDIKNRDDILIEKNRNLLKQIDIYVPDLFSESKVPNISYDSVSIYKKNTSDLNKCNSNNTVLYIVDGTIKLYLFNPKHKEEIKNKDLQNIRKWSHIKKLNKGDYLSIPTNWFYILDCDDSCVIYNKDINNIFTVIPNFIRDNYSSFTLPDFITSVI